MTVDCSTNVASPHQLTRGRRENPLIAARQATSWRKLGTIDVPNPVRPNAIAITAHGEGIFGPIACYEKREIRRHVGARPEQPDQRRRSTAEGSADRFRGA